MLKSPRTLWFMLGLLLLSHSTIGSRAWGSSLREAAPVVPPIWPAWMEKLAAEILPPSDLSQERQDACEQRILSALNDQFGVHFSDNDVAEIDLPAWPTVQLAFMKGGGYNIRIVATGLSKSEVDRIHSGRFVGHLDGVPDDLKPSLHLPEKISGAAVFSKSITNGTGTVDFVAHIDTAYAYAPLGFLVHVFSDIVDAARRNPCP